MSSLRAIIEARARAAQSLIGGNISAHGDALKELARAMRTGFAEAVSAVVAAVPALEHPFIAIGSRAARWYWPGTVYWEGHQALTRRLRASGRRFRPVNVSGHELVLDVTDDSGGWRYFRCAPYEPQLTSLVTNTLRPGSVFVDVGANIGFFTVLAARCVSPGGRVAAFEPHPVARAQLVEMLALNGLSQLVTVSPAALSDRSMPAAPLFLASASVLSTLDPTLAPLGAEHPFVTSVDVPVSTLDDWFDAADPAWRRCAIDLIKIDVEGIEERVVRGMARTLAANPAVKLVCETAAGSPADEILRAAGFSSHLLDFWRPGFGNYLYSRP